jgi:7,8-dihydro-6-hydroxymethylpterin-pyrophosphokinase
LLDPYDVLAITQKIENDIGRQKSDSRPKGPRAIDIDIILFGDEKINDKTLTIPHKSWKKRNFVLVPLLDVDEKLALIYPIKEWIEENQRKGNQDIECLGEFVLG